MSERGALGAERGRLADCRERGVPWKRYEAGMELGRRLNAIFLRDAGGRRPVFGGTAKFQTDPHWRDCLLFFEYFHGDNGAGIGANHQTGWTGLVARTLQMAGQLTSAMVLESGSVAPALVDLYSRR